MESQTHPSVFIISGPIGVGKTATTKALAGLIPNSVCISGDFLLEQLDAAQSKISWERRLEITW
jgi:ABC-type multidrug transport system ATPase subunit